MVGCLGKLFPWGLALDPLRRTLCSTPRSLRGLRRTSTCLANTPEPDVPPSFETVVSASRSVRSFPL